MTNKPGQMSDDKNDEYSDDEYSDMELLELLESLREDMEELGVTTLAEIIERIDELNKRLDAR